MRVSWPFTGRQSELEFVERALARGGGHGVVLAGPCGVGKTRLAAEAVALARSKGFTCLRAIGTAAAAAIPFGPLAHLLPEHLPDAQHRDNVLRLAADALLSQAGRPKRLVLVVDDAHLLDSHSAALLHYLILRADAFLILTVRTGEPVPDPIVGLWKDEHCDRLELQPLPRPEIAQLLEAALGGAVHSTTSYRFWELTQGNVLYLRELVLCAVEEGSLSESGGLWRWHGEVGRNPRLREILRLRLGGLSDDERDALEVAAVGEPLELEILRTLAKPEAVDRLERRGLLEEARGDRALMVRPSHPLYGEILRHDIPVSRADGIRLRLAAAVEASGSKRADDMLRIATWLMSSNATGRPELFTEAAGRALALCDYLLAEKLARAAIHAGARLDGSFLLSRALIGEAKFEQAEELLADLTAEPAADAQRAGATLMRAFNLVWDLGRPDEALEVLATAEGSVPDPALRTALTAARASHLVFTGRFAEARDVSTPLLEGSLDSPSVLLDTLTGIGVPLSYCGQPDAALRLLDQHRDRIQVALPTLPHGPVWLLTYQLVGYLLAGKLFEGEALMDRAHQDALTHGPDWLGGYTQGCLGAVLGSQGRVHSAARLLREAVALISEANVGGQLPGFQAELARCFALQGDAAGAQRMLDAAEAGRLPGERFFDGWLARVRVWIAVARGEVTQAARLALESADDLGQRGWRSQQAIALHDAARLGRANAVAVPLAKVAGESDSRLVQAYAHHARARATRGGNALDQASATFEGMGALLLAAEAAAEASRVHEAAGARRAALNAAEQATRLAARCEGARTPALAEFVQPLPLTRREREVAALAARGLSNREIADRLVVSVRTVANHLHSAYMKLGIEGREQLRSVADFVTGASGEAGLMPRPTAK